MSLVLANRYARALADVIASTGKYREVLQELAAFTSAYRASAELRDIFAVPSVSLREKMNLLEALLARLQVSPETANFLRLLLTKYRLGLIEEIYQAFHRIANERVGIVQVKVTAPRPLVSAEQELLRSHFRTLTGKEAELEFHLDENLLGGLVAQIGSTIYDGSLRGQLERLRRRLMAG